MDEHAVKSEPKCTCGSDDDKHFLSCDLMQIKTLVKTPMKDDFNNWLEREPTTKLGQWLYGLDPISFGTLIGSFLLAGVILMMFSIWSALQY